MCKRYVKKPIAVEAIQWIGLNKEDMIKFSKDINFVVHEDVDTTINKLVIHTLEGDMEAHLGDYIIKGVRGEVYPCAREIFEETYEEVEEE